MKRLRICAFSQVVKFVAERLDLNALLLHTVLLLGRDSIATLLPRIVALLRHTDSHVEIGNLVSVLTWRRHLDRTSPVKVEVTEGVGQRLQLNFLQRRLIEGHVEVCGEDAALVGT